MVDVPEQALAAVGRTVAAEDEVTAAPVEAMMAAFARAGRAPRRGDPLPPLWHGLFCTAKLPPDRLSADGLPADEPLLPALPAYLDRLFGGARFTFERPIRIGETIRRESAIAGFEAKEGRSGAFLIARVEHRVVGPAGLAVLEENDVIFRPPGDGAASSGQAARPPTLEPFGAGAWRRSVDPDPVLMFRHSALTFNSHRIHYDRDFARAAGHPGLLVQGTLIARLMLELVHERRPGAELATFAFRSGRPLYDTTRFTIEALPAEDGRAVDLHAVGQDGGVAMTATAVLRG